MADVFISYSKIDRPLAIKLSAFLEAQGYSPWWDDNLEVADTFRNTIMQELGEARAVIVLWTEVSIASDWVRAEAGRARQQKKLIPVKSKNLSHDYIPVPFGEMHTADITDEAAILQAVKTALTKPQVQRSPLVGVWKKARYEFLVWFGIIGGAITLASNFDGLIKLSNTLRWIFENWVWLLKNMWNALIFFQLQLSAYDAVFLTIFVLIIGNVIRSCRIPAFSETAVNLSPDLGLLSGVGVIAFSLVTGFVGVTEKQRLDGFKKLDPQLLSLFPNDLNCQERVNEYLLEIDRFSQYKTVMGFIPRRENGEEIRPIRYWAGPCAEKFGVDIEKLPHLAKGKDVFSNREQYGSLTYSVYDLSRNMQQNDALRLLVMALLLLPVILPFCIYKLACVYVPMRLETGALSGRLWRMIAGVALIIVFNYLMLWVEQRPLVVEIMARLREM